MRAGGGARGRLYFWSCPGCDYVQFGGSLKALYSEPPLQHLHLLPPPLQRWRRVRNAQRRSLEEPERGGLLSPDRAPQRQLFSRGTARGHRRVSAPALGGWEGDAVNGAQLGSGTEAGAPRRGGAWSAAWPAPCSCQGCAPGRRGPRLPPRAPEAPGSVRRLLAAPGRRTHAGASCQDPGLAFPALTAQPAFLQRSRAKKTWTREHPWNLLALLSRPQAWGPRDAGHLSEGDQSRGEDTLARPLVARSPCLSRPGTCVARQQPQPPAMPSAPLSSHLSPNLSLPLGSLPWSRRFVLRFVGSQGYGHTDWHIVSTQ